MIERYLLLFEYHGIRPILCITKTDLHELDYSEYEIFDALGLPIFFITESQDEELSRLKEFISGNTVVFVGNS
jgi:ribosome biogenesis GTPase